MLENIWKFCNIFINEQNLVSKVWVSYTVLHAHTRLSFCPTRFGKEKRFKVHIEQFFVYFILYLFDSAWSPRN